MFLVSLLALTVLITFSTSTPLSYVTYQRRDGLADGIDDVAYNVPYLIDGRSSVNDIYWPQSEEDSTKMNNSINDIGRVKKIHSLSVTNSLDVLRQRVLLELARRKALQDQLQIDANRRFLNNIGKRSNTHLKMNFLPTIDTNKNQILDYVYADNHGKSNLPAENSLIRSLYWVNRNDFGDQYDEGDELREVESRKINLL